MKRIRYSIKNLGNGTGEISIRGVIGISNKDEEWMGMTFEGQGGTVREFEQELQALGEVGQINLYISSEGGYVTDGLAIHNMLKRHSAKKTCFVDGYAYSIATVIVAACDEVRMPSNALLMIHNASTWCDGDYRDMERQAEALKVHNEAIRNAYAAKSGRSAAEFTALMDAETYLDGPAAKALGLVDVVTDEMKLKNLRCSKAFRNSAAFDRLPARFAAAFDTSAPASPIAASSTSSPMKATLALATALGVQNLSADMSEDQIAAAITAHKPQSPNVVIDFEDAAVKAAFDKHIANAIAISGAADKAKITALETELANIKALITNGAAGAAGGGNAAPVKNADEKKEMTRAAFNQLPHHERNAFMAAGGKLIG